MILMLNIGVFLSLGIIAFFDFKERQFPWWAILIGLSCLVSLGLLQTETGFFLQNSLLNLGFVLVQLLLLSLWFLIKQRKLINIVDKYLGLGDILFFATTCFAFSFANFMVYHFVSLLFTLITALVMMKLSEDKQKEIPAAGILSFFLAGVLGVSALLDFNLYDDSWFRWA